MGLRPPMPQNQPWRTGGRRPNQCKRLILRGRLGRELRKHLGHDRPVGSPGKATAEEKRPLAIASFQNTQFKLAELRTETQVARVFIDRCIGLSLQGELTIETAAMAKYWTTDLQCKVIDECLQLHGGYGYMRDYAIGRAFVDARAQRIYGGTNEIMKEIVSRTN